MKKSFIIKILYSVGIIGVLLIMIQLFGNTSTSVAKILETLNLIILLAIIFFSDIIIRKLFSEEAKCSEETREIIKNLQQENSNLTDKIEKLEDKENEALRLSSYRDRVILELLNSKQKIKDRHNILHLFSEIFQAGLIILYKESKQNNQFVVEATYAVPEDYSPSVFELGEGLNGQAAKDGAPMVIENIPEDYISISSGLGKTKNVTLYLLPIMKEQKCIYLVEMLAFSNNDIAKIWSDIAEKIVEKEIL